MSSLQAPPSPIKQHVLEFVPVTTCSDLIKPICRTKKCKDKLCKKAHGNRVGSSCTSAKYCVMGDVKDCIHSDCVFNHFLFWSDYVKYRSNSPEWRKNHIEDVEIVAEMQQKHDLKHGYTPRTSPRTSPRTGSPRAVCSPLARNPRNPARIRKVYSDEGQKIDLGTSRMNDYISSPNKSQRRESKREPKLAPRARTSPPEKTRASSLTPDKNRVKTVVLRELRSSAPAPLSRSWADEVEYIDEVEQRNIYLEEEIRALKAAAEANKDEEDFENDGDRFFN